MGKLHFFIRNTKISNNNGNEMVAIKYAIVYNCRCQLLTYATKI